MKIETAEHKSARIARKERRKQLATRKRHPLMPRQLRLRTIIRGSVADRRTVTTPHGHRIVNARASDPRPTAPRYVMAWYRTEYRGMVRFEQFLTMGRK